MELPFLVHSNRKKSWMTCQSWLFFKPVPIHPIRWTGTGDANISHLFGFQLPQHLFWRSHVRGLFGIPILPLIWVAYIRCTCLPGSSLESPVPAARRTMLTMHSIHTIAVRHCSVRLIAVDGDLYILQVCIRLTLYVDRATTCTFTLRAVITYSHIYFL